MKVKRLYAALNLPGRMVLETTGGQMMEFNLTPCRALQEKDLQPLPGFFAKGNQAQEAPDYMLAWYGLEKEGAYNGCD